MFILNEEEGMAGDKSTQESLKKEELFEVSIKRLNSKDTENYVPKIKKPKERQVESYKNSGYYKLKTKHSAQFMLEHNRVGVEVLKKIKNSNSYDVDYSKLQFSVHRNIIKSSYVTDVFDPKMWEAYFLKNYLKNKISKKTRLSYNFMYNNFFMDNFNEIEFLKFNSEPYSENLKEVYIGEGAFYFNPIDHEKKYNSNFVIKECFFKYKNCFFQIVQGSNTLGSLFYFSTDDTSIVSLMSEFRGWFFKYTVSVIPSEAKPIAHIVVGGLGQLSLQPYDIKQIKGNFLQNYNTDFLKVNKIIIDHLKNKKTGLALFHGLPGTGKTYYIRYLIKKLMQKKKVIIMPMLIAQEMSSPAFLNFLMAYCKNSILIIEDSEFLIKSRENGNVGSNISDLLNMTDGLLGDALNIQIICSFNIKISQVDSALLRKGRLIAEYYFDYLEDDRVLEIAKRLNIEDKLEPNKKYVLADLYNIEKELPRSTQKRKRIGFQ